MTSKPPRAAVWLVELFAPIESAEGVLGDLEEEFAGRLTRSGDRPARRWYWRQALRTTVHLVLGAVRARAVVDHRAGAGQPRCGPRCSTS